MKNEIIRVNESTGLENMTNEEMDLMMQQLMHTKMNRIENALKETVNKVSQIEQAMQIEKEDTQLKLDKLEDKHNQTQEIVAASQRTDKSRYKYVDLRDIGKSYKISISSVMFGRLLRVVGIALPNKKGSTEPKRQYVMAKNSMAKTEITDGGYEFWVWNKEKIIKYIDKWLKENGFYAEFYSIDNEKDMKDFINQLFNDYL